MEGTMPDVVDPGLECSAVEYLMDFQRTLNDLELQFRDIESSKEIIKGALQTAGQFYQADRAYVLEVDWDLHVGVNTYEWCADTASPRLIHSQCISLELVPRLEQYLRCNEPMVIKNVEDIRTGYPAEYRDLTSQGITSMMATPYSKRINTGFLVVDNPRKYPTNPGFLLILTYVVVLELNEIKQHRSLDMASRRVSRQRPMDVYINMFGRFEVASSKGVLNDDDFTTEQGCCLLAYMVLNRKIGCSSRMLCEALWPDMESEDPYNAIKSVVYRLRTTLSCIGLRDLIMASHGSFTLNPAYTIYTDVDRFEVACARLNAASKPENQKRIYQGIMNLYKGSLLASHDSFLWLLPKASYYQNRYLQQLKNYMRFLYPSGDFLEIQRIAAEALTIDMYDGDIHYAMILAILRQGNRSVARAHFKQAEPYLYEEQKKELIRML